jgi:hypothetical protein
VSVGPACLASGSRQCQTQFRGHFRARRWPLKLRSDRGQSPGPPCDWHELGRSSCGPVHCPELPPPLPGAGGGGSANAGAMVPRLNAAAKATAVRVRFTVCLLRLVAWSALVVAGRRTVVRVAGALAGRAGTVTTVRGRRRVSEGRHPRRQQQRCGKGRRNAPHGKLRHDDPPSPSGAPYVRHLCSLIGLARHAVNTFGKIIYYFPS